MKGKVVKSALKPLETDRLQGSLQMFLFVLSESHDPQFLYRCYMELMSIFETRGEEDDELYFFQFVRMIRLNDRILKLFLKSFCGYLKATI